MSALVTTIPAFDRKFRYMYEVPSHLVTHMPHVHPSNPHVMICTYYKPYYPHSCPMGNGCKFVHADIDYGTLEAHPIHVNYIWRHHDLCTYDRLRPGGVLEVLLPNNKKPVEKIASERLLITQAFLSSRRSRTKPFSHCAHYYFNGVCHRGASCNFVHAVAVNPEVDPEPRRIFRRSQRRQHAGSSKTISKSGGESSCCQVSACNWALPTVCSGERLHNNSATSDVVKSSEVSAPRRPRVYRHNPYQQCRTE